MTETETTTHFGEVEKPLPDWRKKDAHDPDDGNDLDTATAADVMAVLGFDPDEEPNQTNSKES